MPGACLSHAGCIDGFSPAGFQSSVLPPVIIFVRFSLIPAALQQQQQHFRRLLKLAMPGSGASVLLTMKLCLTVFPLLCVLLSRAGQPSSAATQLTSDGRVTGTLCLVPPRRCEFWGEFSRGSFELSFASQLDNLRTPQWGCEPECSLLRSSQQVKTALLASGCMKKTHVFLPLCKVGLRLLSEGDMAINEISVIWDAPMVTEEA